MLNIFDWIPVWIGGRTRISIVATELYGSIVTQARQQDFYTAYGVLDVAEKRYEMIVLHIVLVLERLRASGEEGTELGRELVEAFVRDLDGSIREMAIGDTKVPTNVKKAAAGLLDRDVLYRQAFGIGVDEQTEPGDMTLDGLLDELLFEGKATPGAAALTKYVRASRQTLSGWTHGDGVEKLMFAEPKTFVTS